MVMPSLSVTVIGIVVGVVASLHWGLTRGLIRGIAGAWLGFGVGALVGALADVTSGTGIWLAVIGHLGAFTGAVFLGRSGAAVSENS